VLALPLRPCVHDLRNLIRQKIDDADRFPLSPHKRRKSGHFLTAASCHKRTNPPKRTLGGILHFKSALGLKERGNQVQKRNISATIVANVRRFCHQINMDEVFDTHQVMRQIAGAFHEFKARLVAKLKAARQRKRSTAALSPLPVIICAAICPSVNPSVDACNARRS